MQQHGHQMRFLFSVVIIRNIKRQLQNIQMVLGPTLENFYKEDIPMLPYHMMVSH